MFSFAKIREYILRFINPSIYMGGLDYVIKLWKYSDMKNRGILLLVFSPMFFCLAGFILSIIYFVLFVLPSFLFRFLGWGILTALFGSGGKYCYKYFTGHNISNNTSNAEFIDVQYTEEVKSESEDPAKKSTRRRKTDA